MGSGKFLFRDPTVAECVLSITARRELAQRLNTPYALDRLVAAEGPDDPLPLKAIRARPNGDATVAARGDLRLGGRNDGFPLHAAR